MDIFLIIFGFIILIIGGNLLVKGSVALAIKLKVSMIVIGLTVVSFATSAPELMVSVYAALSGHSDMALGNVIGSNITNISLVLGVTAFIFPLSFEHRLYRFDIPVMLFASLLFAVFLHSESNICFWEGLVFVVFLLILMIYLISQSRKIEANEQEGSNHEQLSIFKLSIYIVAGGISLYYGSRFLVDGATGLASTIGVSDRVISVSIIAFGTSIPELAASIIAAFNKNKGLSIGNLIGSNIFNIFAVLGITSMIKPINVVDQSFMSNDIWWMFGLSLLLYPIMFFFKKEHIGRLEGLFLFFLYLSYISLSF